MTTAEFIVAHRTDNPRQLALQASRFPDVDMPYALSQIQGWQAARRKLPSFAANQDIVYPPHLSMEQCSSEATALYKAEAVRRLLDSFKGEEDASDKGFGDSMTDLTGGFGVDFYFVSRYFRRAQYTERNAELCKVVEHNLKVLGADNASVVCGDAVEQLRTIDPQTLIFIDPARRDAHGARTFAISDCTPDVMELLPDLRRKARFVMIKLSPMLDWHKAVSDLHPLVTDVDIVAVDGECKELLLTLDMKRGDAHNDDNTQAAKHDYVGVRCADLPSSSFAFRYTSDGGCAIDTPQPTDVASMSPLLGADHTPSYLYEPNASVMKAGCFRELELTFGASQISANSHLFTSEQLIPGFPGRRFAIDTVTSFNKRQLKEALRDVTNANITVRNFPMTVAVLRKKLKLKDGGNTYIFATTTDGGEHVLLITHKE
jgi:hypothetical protein